MASELNALLLFGYILLLLGSLLAPFAAHALKPDGGGEKPRQDIMLCGALAVIGLVIILRGRDIFPLIPLLIIPFLGKGWRPLVGAGLALSLFSSTTWWGNPVAYMPAWQWLLFILVAGVAGYAARAALSGAHTNARFVPLDSRWVFALSALAALVVGSATAPFIADARALMAWHHWGAYLSPVDLLLSGGVPYQDFPVQYGIGPTLLLAANCGSDCWNGMFYVVLVTNALYVATMTSAAALVTQKLNIAMRAMVVAAMLCATLFWTAFPVEFSSTMATPSVAGLRFLPFTALLLFILARQAKAEGGDGIGHGLWLLAVIWSIESAAFASLLWWPWLACRAIAADDGSKTVLAKLTYHAALGAVSLAIALCGIAVALRAGFGAWPDPQSVFAYFQNPPGRIPPNVAGPVWLIIFLALFAIKALLRRQKVAGSPLYPSLVALLVSFSYYLSRSHDNNILNLLPFALLVALSLLADRRETDAHESGMARSYAAALILASIALVPLFNFAPWAEAVRQKKLVSLGPETLLRQFSPRLGGRDTILPNDAIELIQHAQRKSGYAPAFFDDHAVMPLSPPGEAWTNVNSIANYAPLPQDLIEHYVRQGGKRYRRTGWLIVQRESSAKWLASFADSYKIRLARTQGKYSAFTLTPR